MVGEASRTIGGAGGFFSKIDSLRAGFERQIMTRHRHAASRGVPETIRATGIITSKFHFWRDFAYLARFMLGEGFLVIPERMTSCLDNSF